MYIFKAFPNDDSNVQARPSIEHEAQNQAVCHARRTRYLSLLLQIQIHYHHTLRHAKVLHGW